MKIKMKIRVRYSASQSERHEIWTPEDLGFTEQEWKELPEDKKREALMTAAESEPPYWAVDSFEEN